MPEIVTPGPVSAERSIREAVCVHTKKIFDSCKDKDCVEDLRVYPTMSSQELLDRAMSVKARSAELLWAQVDVQPVSFNRGFFTVDVRFFYRICADAFVGAARPAEVSGLAVFDKRAILFGSEGGAKVFSSRDALSGAFFQDGSDLPGAVVEAVDPMVLNLKLVDVCQCRPCDFAVAEIPGAIIDAFGEELVQGGDVHRLYATLGQFSIIRLERDTHLLMPAYDYCMPDKECPGDIHEEDPCELFRRVRFPVNEFFPPNSIPSEDGFCESGRPCGC